MSWRSFVGGMRFALLAGVLHVMCPCAGCLGGAWRVGCICVATHQSAPSPKAYRRRLSVMHSASYSSPQMAHMLRRDASVDIHVRSEMFRRGALCFAHATLAPALVHLSPRVATLPLRARFASFAHCFCRVASQCVLRWSRLGRGHAISLHALPLIARGACP